MARQVLPIVGAVIGAYFGGPQGAQLGYAIGSLVGNAVDPLVVQGPKLGEAGLQTSAEGVYRPIVYGTAAVKGNVIERGNRIVRTQRDQAGKGGGPVTETQRVYWTYGIRICEGPVEAILRIWRDGKLVYDIRPDTSIPNESAEFRLKFNLYLGTESQLPDPDLEAFRGIGNVNSYRGTCYIVFPNDDLTDLGERIPDYRFEVAQIAEVSESITDFEYVQQIGNQTRDIAYGNQRFFSVGSTGSQGEIWEGDFEGLNFTKLIGVVPDNWQMRSIAYGQSGFIASRDTADILRSSTGIGWDTESAVSPSAYLVVKYDGTHYIRLGLSGSGDRSPDGINWEPITVGMPDSIFYALTGGGSTVALGANGSIRFTTDSGLTWDTSTVVSDPHPFIGFTGAAASGSIWRAYKTISINSMCVYTSTNGGVGWTAQDYIVPAGSYNGGEIGIINGYWVGTSPAVLPPAYPRIYSSPDGLPPFTQRGLFGGPGTTADSQFVRVIDSQSGIGLLVGRQNDGQCFLFRNDYRIGETGLGDPVPLSSIVSDLCIRGTLEEEQFDVEELDDMVDGLVLAGDYTCADAIRTMSPIYFFDGVECDSGTGYKLNFIKRGKPVIATLTEDDLIDVPDRTIREDSLERPRVLHMHFENPDVGYVPAKASPRRYSPDVKVVGEISTQVPVVFSDVDEAWQRADILLKMAWTEVAGEEQFSTGDNWMRLVPSDCIGLSLRGQVRRLRITESEYSNGVVKFKFLPDRQSSYTSSLTGIPLPPTTPPLPSIVGQTIGEFMDLPALTDNNDRLLYYVAATGQSPAWYGARVQRNVSGSGFQDVANFNFNTIMGVILSDVPSASEHYTDITNHVEVELYTSDVLDSFSHQEFLSERGAFALENTDGSWEVMQYMNSEEQSDGSFRLSTLLRGRLNSGASNHTVGARFVLLDGVLSVDATTALIGEQLTHRYISHGQSADGVPSFVDTYSAKSQTEFPVAHILLDRTSEKINIRIVPRHRFGTEDHPVRSINWSGYRISISDSGANISTFESLNDNLSFDATGWTFPVTVTVSQLNRYTGAGPAVSEEIE